jgi:hypothetical protein
VPPRAKFSDGVRLRQSKVNNVEFVVSRVYEMEGTAEVFLLPIAAEVWRCRGLASKDASKVMMRKFADKC